MNVTEFDTIIHDLIGPPREKTILDTFNTSNIPSWLSDQKHWVPVKLGSRVTILTSPDYAAIGNDTSYRRIATNPFTAQRIVERLHAILPTRAMVNAIYQAANTKLPSKPFPPDDKMETSQRMADHDAAIGPQLPSRTNLIAGHKKDIVVGPDLDGSKVAIYGWQPDPSKFPHQPYSTVHGSYYADYSHGIRPVSRWAMVDGKVTDIFNVFRDSSLLPLVSDQGSFVPVFPSKGAKWPSEGASAGGGGLLAGAIAGFAVGGPVGALFGAAVGVAADSKKK